MKDCQVIAKVIVQNKAGQILLIKRSESDVRRPNQWDYPGGFVELGEEYMKAAIRETEEETGIVISIEDLKLAFTLTEHSSDDMNTSWLTFITKVDNPDVMISHEHSEYIWVPLDEALTMITYDRQLKALNHINDNKLFNL